MRSQIWHTLSWAHPRQVGVLLCTLLDRTVWSTIRVSHSVGPDSLRPHGLHCPWDFSRKDTVVHCCFILQGMFPTKGLTLGHLHCRQILYWPSYKGSWQSTIVQYFYFKPTISERKHKCSGNIDGTTIKIVLSCSAVFNFGNIWTVVSQAPLAMGIL